jgi:hypothetical protein
MKNRNFKANSIHQILLIIAISSYSVFAYVSTIPKGRFINRVFNNYSKTGPVKFDTTTNPLNNNAPIGLYFDLYEPSGDTCSARPCIVCMYGGGFTGGDRSQQAGEAITFTYYGYVAVCPDYRKWGNENDAAHKIWPAGFVVTAQDARKCIRYLRAHASTYRIDTARIAIEGCSSGAYITLNTAFMDKPSKIPKVVDTTVFGGIEGRSGTLGVSSRVCAAAGNSGAMLDTGWIEAGSVPYCGYQSTPDSWGVPTDTGTPVSHWGPYFTYYGITPISVRLTHLGILNGTLVAAPNQHCPGGFADSSHLFFYNSICQVGRRSGPNSNLARGKTATQSSTDANRAASRAVDGIVDGNAANGSVSITASEQSPWWQVDLGTLNIIDSIVLYNRTDCCGDHERDFDLKFGLDGIHFETCAYERDIAKSPSKYSFRNGILGRYIRIQLRGSNSLQLAEVQVWGRDTGSATEIGFPNKGRFSRSSPAITRMELLSNGNLNIPTNSGAAPTSVEIYDIGGRLLLSGISPVPIRKNFHEGIYIVKSNYKSEFK